MLERPDHRSRFHEVINVLVLRYPLYVARNVPFKADERFCTCSSSSNRAVAASRTHCKIVIDLFVAVLVVILNTLSRTRLPQATVASVPKNIRPSPNCAP